MTMMMKEARYKDWDMGITLSINIPIQRAHNAVVGLVILIIFTIVTAALCVIGIMMYGRRVKRYNACIFYYFKALIVSSVEPVKYTRYSKLPVNEPDEGNPFEDDDDDEMLK